MASNFNSNSSVSEPPIDLLNSQQEQQQVSQQEQQVSQQEQQPDPQSEATEEDGEGVVEEGKDSEEADDKDEEPEQTEDEDNSNSNSQGNFFEENKSLLTKVYKILKLKFPSLNISLSELITAAQKYIDVMIASNPGHGGGVGVAGDGDEPKPEIDNSSELVKNLQEYAKKNWIRPVTISDCKRNVPTSGGRQFGAKRGNGKRAHSAIDFVVDKKQEKNQIFYAITSGTIIGYSSTYYSGTGAIAVKSDDGSVIRYCEIKAYDKYIAYNKKNGEKNVKKGDALGEIIRNDDAEHSRMLHLEIYLGNAKGNLTDRKNRDDNRNYPYIEANPKYIEETWYMNFERRMDLINPTFVNMLKDVNGN